MCFRWTFTTTLNIFFLKWELLSGISDNIILQRVCILNGLIFILLDTNSYHSKTSKTDTSSKF